MRKKIELEYIFRSSVKVLYPRLTTNDGLSEWFASHVENRGNKYTFYWDKHSDVAELVFKRAASIRFHWEYSPEDEYFEFSLQPDPLTGDVALIITDFADDDEEDDQRELWNEEVERLARTIGARIL